MAITGALPPPSPSFYQGGPSAREGRRGTREKGKLSSLHVMILVDRDWNQVLRGTCLYVLISRFILVVGSIYIQHDKERKKTKTPKCIKGTTLMSSKSEKDSVNIWWMHLVFFSDTEADKGFLKIPLRNGILLYLLFYSIISPHWIDGGLLSILTDRDRSTASS